MTQSNLNEINKLEHDNTYHVKKVAQYGDDGNNGLARLYANGFQIGTYDYVAITYPATTSEVYTFKTGGSGGTTIATITIVYTDTTKADLSSVTKS